MEQGQGRVGDAVMEVAEVGAWWGWGGVTVSTAGSQSSGKQRDHVSPAAPWPGELVSGDY